MIEFFQIRVRNPGTVHLVFSFTTDQQLQRSKVNIRFYAKDNDLAQGCPTFSDSGSTFAKICSKWKSLGATDRGNYVRS